MLRYLGSDILIKEDSRPRTLFMKQIIEGIENNNYKELKVAMMDRDKWRSIEVIEPI